MLINSQWIRLTGGHWSGSELVLLGSEWTNKGGVKARLRSSLCVFTFLPPLLQQTHVEQGSSVEAH